jgi:hypothetical protein
VLQQSARGYVGTIPLPNGIRSITVYVSARDKSGNSTTEGTRINRDIRDLALPLIGR